MSALVLRHVDETRRMARFYRLDVQPDLFGGWSLVREWGRIGRGGQVRLDPYPTADEASAQLEDLRRAKQRKGYVAAHG